MGNAKISFLVMSALLTGCGGGGEDRNDIPPSQETHQIFDEAVNGELPYNLYNLTEGQLPSVTFPLIKGINVVRGTSNAGEMFIVSVPAGASLISVKVVYNNHIENNDHVLFVHHYPLGSSVITAIHPMVSVGENRFSVAPAETAGSGLYEVYSGTSVTGPLEGNAFSLALEVK